MGIKINFDSTLPELAFLIHDAIHSVYGPVFQEFCTMLQNCICYRHAHGL